MKVGPSRILFLILTAFVLDARVVDARGLVGYVGGDDDVRAAPVDKLIGFADGERVVFRFVPGRHLEESDRTASLEAGNRLLVGLHRASVVRNVQITTLNLSQKCMFGNVGNILTLNTHSGRLKKETSFVNTSFIRRAKCLIY